MSLGESKKRYKEASTVQKKKLANKHWSRGLKLKYYISNQSPKLIKAKRLDAIIILDTYIVSNLMEMSYSRGTDSDDNLT